MATYSEFTYSDYFKTELPSHWQEKRLGFLSLQTKNAFVDGPFGSDLKSDDYLDEGVPLIQLNNIRDGKHILRNMKFISDNKKQGLIRHLAIPQDIVIAKMAEPVARAAVVSDEFDEYVIVADCVKLTPNLQLVDLEFLIWAINSDCVRENAELVSTGTTRIRINLGELKKLKVPYPSLPEQIKIREYLDHETTKIDHLIEKQQQLIELLKEKRQAVISHAVTKGLDPNVPMKDSGVEWLGEVPEHWNVTCLARISGIKRGSGYQNIEMEVEGQDSIQMLRIADMHEIAPALIVKNTEVIRYLVEEGDILVAGTGATAGISMLVPKECNGWVHSYNSIKVKVDSKKVNSAFLQLFLISDYIKKSLDVSFVGSAQPFVDTNGLGRLRVLLPPLHEQINIYDYLNIQTRKIDLLISKAQSAIQLMQERRTALISATVTGKIDVRNWQAPNVTEAHTELSA